MCTRTIQNRSTGKITLDQDNVQQYADPSKGKTVLEMLSKEIQHSRQKLMFQIKLPAILLYTLN